MKMNLFLLQHIERNERTGLRYSHFHITIASHWTFRFPIILLAWIWFIEIIILSARTVSTGAINRLQCDLDSSKMLNWARMMAKSFVERVRRSVRAIEMRCMRCRINLFARFIHNDSAWCEGRFESLPSAPNSPQFAFETSIGMCDDISHTFCYQFTLAADNDACDQQVLDSIADLQWTGELADHHLADRQVHGRKVCLVVGFRCAMDFLYVFRL